MFDVNHFMENDVFADVKSVMDELLSDGLSMSYATAEVLDQFGGEEDDDIDDAPYVHIAIAMSQLEHGKILKKTKARTLELIDARIEALQGEPDETGHISTHTEQLRLFRAMVENEERIRRPRPKPVICKWKEGDIYAFQLEGPEAERLGISGHYALLIMKQRKPVGRNIFPFVYVAISEKCELPHNREDILKATILRVDFRKVHRLAIFCNSEEDLSVLIYVGNFPDIRGPKDEYIFEDRDLEIFGRSYTLEELPNLICENYEEYVLGEQ